ncbi:MULTISPECIES: fimbria/pilus chaperone family protein [Providencia]|uniref:Gram-negative pili assembly chaperone domain protein n=2 Tax=Providencia stuartii TaxID=588 RepID=A0AA86YX59_PROST|nr:MULTISPECIES: fimbria/pilus chaperone family protein [Providencia]EDU60184.1 putative gram-negative pili assembly chaperone domain protein [Providencia stuartii ATCC 25827]MBN5559849.1 fimbria/pilus periplasmic chaperone [Providencia stuartii]MBN5599825.1 fimbria/pilus periplasmic chaperone [Providencia stuartii]MBN5603343.1 fimbria/pilus periplasmic chaperone [Providencia stuartii]MCL8326401.1 fimbria/pilus chaperone family protein [Providencia thailandensis]
MKKIFATILSSFLLIVSTNVHASFQLETMTVILDAGEGRKVFNVKNTGNSPILLSTKVEELDGSTKLAGDIMISPPIVRIEPQQSQQINFILKKGVDISDEVILKASFQGIGASKENVTKMPIRQDVAMLVSPANMKVSQTPWDALSVSQKNNQLTLKNNGKQVIRLSPSFKVLPSNEDYALDQFYIRPGESKVVNIKGNATNISISPLSRYGFKMSDNAILAVEH